METNYVSNKELTALNAFSDISDNSEIMKFKAVCNPINRLHRRKRKSYIRRK